MNSNTSASKNSNRATRPAHDQIAALAYQLFEENDRQDGHDVEHWLKAERLLTQNREASERQQTQAQQASQRNQQRSNRAGDAQRLAA
jgi:hypothetical protein